MPELVDAEERARRHVLTLDDLRADAIRRILDRATALKAGREHERLDDRTLALLFEQPSTRTRASFEAGMTMLGGHAMFLGPGETQLARGEPIRDTARALSQYVDAAALRVADHGDLAEFAEHSTVPVINALSDRAHPCQALADLLTIREQFGSFETTRAAWIGDGNNVCASFAIGCAAMGIDLTIATPCDYALPDDVLERTAAVGSPPITTTDPVTAVDGADVVYTDVWVSMSDELTTEAKTKLDAFDGFQLNEALLGQSPAKVMHCLPAHRGHEISDAVLEGDRSIVWSQAANRMYVQCALLLELLEEDASPFRQTTIDHSC